MKKLLVFYGHKGSGKDTCVSIIEEKDKHVGRFSFANSLKKTVWSLFQNRIGNKQRIFGSITFKEEPIEGWKIPENIKQSCGFTEEYWTGRRLLQWFGTDVCRNVYELVWVDKLIEELYNNKHIFDTLTITDCRFKNEYEAIKNLRGIETIFIKVTRNTETNEFSTHASERDMAYFENKYTIINDGTLKDLENRIYKCLSKI